jgi:hypothetical protein
MSRPGPFRRAASADCPGHCHSIDWRPGRRRLLYPLKGSESHRRRASLGVRT